MCYLEAGHILSNGPKTTSLCFSSVATAITCEIPAETEFRSSAKTTRVHSSVSALQTFYMVLMMNFNPHQFTLKFALFTWLFSVWGWFVVTLWLADFFRKTRCLQPRCRLLTGLLNLASQSSHQQSLQLPQEKQKNPTKGRDKVSRVKY